MQVTDIIQYYYRLLSQRPAMDSPQLRVDFHSVSEMEHPPRLAKRLRLGVAWANPLKGFEISATVCVGPRMGFTQMLEGN